MLQHFNFKPLFENASIPGWAISFYYKQQRFSAEYMKDGKIVWIGEPPAAKDEVVKMIHELMLYHVYD